MTEKPADLAFTLVGTPGLHPLPTPSLGIPKVLGSETVEIAAVTECGPQQTLGGVGEKVSSMMRPTGSMGQMPGGRCSRELSGGGGSTSGWDGVRWRQRTAPAFRPCCVVFWVLFFFFLFSSCFWSGCIIWLTLLGLRSCCTLTLEQCLQTLVVPPRGNFAECSRGLSTSGPLGQPPLAQCSVGTTDNLWDSPAHPREALGFLI